VTDDSAGDEGVPPDVRAALDSLLETVADVDPDREEETDPGTARAALSTARTVAGTKVPDPDERERLVAGCRRAATALDDGDRAVAAEYARATRRRLG